MDWLVERQEKIEDALAKIHLSNGYLVLYDVSSSYMVRLEKVPSRFRRHNRLTQGIAVTI